MASSPAALAWEVALSGFLVAVLIAVWAVVLVPMWAHRNSLPAADSDSSSGARVISRRPTHRARAGRHTARLTSAMDRYAPQSPAAMLRRRQAVLAVLTGGLVLTLLGVPFGVPAPVLMGSAVIFAGYLGWLRLTAVDAAARRSAQRREMAVRGTGFRDFGAPVNAAAAAAVEEGTQPEVEPHPAAMSSPGAPAVAAATAMDRNSGPSTAPWLPVSIPLPSYVTAPPAPAVIDGDWHEEALLEGELPGEASAYALGEEVLRRRAVGD